MVTCKDKLNTKLVWFVSGILFLGMSIWVGCGAVSQDKPAMTADECGSFYTLAVENRFDDSLSVDLVRGKEIFQQYCAICHGESGDGNGFNAYNLKSNFGVEPFDFTDSTKVSAVTIEELEKAIALGGSAIGKSKYMPPWGSTFSDYQLTSLRHYIWSGLMNK